MSSSAPVGFLDSGIGGITVLSKAYRLLPNEDYYFFSDSANNPYGDKSDIEIIERCTEITDMLINKKHCKAVVIACNTASAKAVKELRETFDSTPIIAIEPAYKMVHDQHPQGSTLIMATKGTIASEKFRRLYYSYYDHHTSLINCVGMADLIEQDRRDELLDYLKNLLGRYAGEVHNVVLGCTHYPLAKKEIREVLGDVKFFDGADGVSHRLEYLLSKNDLLNDKKEQGSVEFEDSSPDEKTREEKRKRFYTLLNGESI